MHWFKCQYDIYKGWINLPAAWIIYPAQTLRINRRQSRCRLSTIPEWYSRANSRRTGGREVGQMATEPSTGFWGRKPDTLTSPNCKEQQWAAAKRCVYKSKQARLHLSNVAFAVSAVNPVGHYVGSGQVLLPAPTSAVMREIYVDGAV